MGNGLIDDGGLDACAVVLVLIVVFTQTRQGRCEKRRGARGTNRAQSHLGGHSSSKSDGEGSERKSGSTISCMLFGLAGPDGSKEGTTVQGCKGAAVANGSPHRTRSAPSRLDQRHCGPGMAQE